MSMTVIAALVVVLALVLPMRLHGQAMEARTCAVAARSIARGAVLTSADVSLAREAQCRGATIAADSAPGMLAHRLIRAGEMLRAPAISSAPLLAQGDTVELRLVQGGVQLSLRGTVATPGYAGERVWVRLGPKRRLQGVVTARGLVVAE